MKMMIKFCPDLTSKEDVPITIGTVTFTGPVLHKCLQNKCVAYKFGKCLKYNNYEEFEEPCAYCKETYKYNTMAYLKAKDCYVRKVDKRKE